MPREPDNAGVEEKPSRLTVQIPDKSGEVHEYKLHFVKQRATRSDLIDTEGQPAELPEAQNLAPQGLINRLAQWLGRKHR